MFKKSFTSIATITATVLLFLCTSVKATTFTDNTIVDTNKKWMINFNKEIIFDDLSRKSINVIDSEGNLAPVVLKLGQNNKNIIVDAPIGGYKEGEMYKLIIDNKVHSKNNKHLKQTVTLKFSIKKPVISDKTDVTNKFSDVNFKNNIYDIIRKNSSKPILYSDIKDITSLDLNNENIKNLSGIEYFTSLTNLDCSNNQLTSLDLSKNTALISLVCNSNNLSNLNVSKNVVLTELMCNNNKLKILDISKNTKLDTLDCRKNNLSNLNISNNSSLCILFCDHNELENIDISKNSNLDIFDCDEAVSKEYK